MMGRVFRVAIAGLILWLLWGERVFWPAREVLPEGAVLVDSVEALGALEPGHAIAIEGKVFPAEAVAVETLWKERFAYRLSTWQKDEFGSSREVVSQQHRPEIRFEWSGGKVVLTANSYQMKSAPKAPGDSLLKTTEHNVGFRAGDSALALGRKIDGGGIKVDELAEGPLGVHLKKLESGNTWRAWVGHGLRVVVSLLALSILVSALRRTKPNSDS